MARKKMKGSSPKSARRKARKRTSIITARKKKEFTYRGYTLEELQALSHDEVLGLLSSRARRSFVRGLNHDQQIFIDRLLKGEKPIMKTHRRDIVILPSFVGKKVGVYNGNEFKTLDITAEMIGHYLGEFALTRKSGTHSGPGVGATKSSKFMPLK